MKLLLTLLVVTFALSALSNTEDAYYDLRIDVNSGFKNCSVRCFATDSDKRIFSAVDSDSASLSNEVECLKETALDRAIKFCQRRSHEPDSCVEKPKSRCKDIRR